MMEKLTNLTKLDLNNCAGITKGEENRYYKSILKQNKITDLKMNVSSWRNSNVDAFIKNLKFTNVLQKLKLNIDFSL